MRTHWRRLLAFVLILLLPALALAERLDTEEALCEFFTQQRLAEVRDFSVKCSSALMKTLKADDYARLKALCEQTGVSKYDLSAGWFGKLTFYDVRYTNPDAIKCQTETDVRVALQNAVENGVTEIELHMTEELYGVMYDDIDHLDIFRLLHQMNIVDCEVRSKRDKELILKNLVPSKAPFAKVNSVNEAGERIAAWKNEPVIHLIWEPEVLQSLSYEELDAMYFLGGLEYALEDCNRSTGLMRISDMHLSDLPGAYCVTEQDVVDAIRAMGVRGIQNFRLKLPQDLFDSLKANDEARMGELHREAGLMKAISFFSGSRAVYYTDAVIMADVPVLRSLDEVMAHMRGCAERGDKDINMLLSADVYAALTENINSIFGSEAKYYDMLSNTGVFSRESDNLSRSAGSIRLRGVAYYPGVNILRAMANGSLASLTDRERQAMAAAQELAAACMRETPVETAKAIHDALCERIIYQSLASTDEDDTCIGALLNGEANCDGYADAMLLVGRLAGLNVIYQHGDSRDESSGGLTVTHVWNLIELDGTWRMIDVTWDDQKSGIGYQWFNVGEDRAAQSHVWAPEMTVPMLQKTDPNNRPVAEYTVSTADEAAEAMRKAQRDGHKAFDLYIAQGSGLDKESLIEAASRNLTGSGRQYWSDSLKCLHIVKD